jgi:hypothetical protein
MTFIVTIPTILSALLLAAHFLRASNYVGVVLSLAAPLLLLSRRWWAVLSVQLLLLIAAGVWLWTMCAIAASRQADGEPVMRMAIILTLVAGWNVLAALLLATPPIRRRVAR